MFGRSLLVTCFIVAACPAAVFGQQKSSSNQKYSRGPSVVAPKSQTTPQLQTHSMQVPQEPAPSNQQIRPQDIQRLIEDMLSQPDALPDGDTPPNIRVESAPRQIVTQSQPVALTHEEIAELSAERQRRLLLIAVLTLEEALETTWDGDGLRQRLATGPLQNAIACGGSVPPSAETRQLLQTIATRFEKTAAIPDYRSLTGSWEFQTLRNGLAAYATDPVEREKGRVVTGIEQLRKVLDREETGAGWNQYLLIDDLQRIAQSKEQMTPRDRDVLATIIERMKEVDSNSSYRVVAAMPGFSIARDALEKWTKQSAVEKLVQEKLEAEGKILRLVDEKTEQEKLEAEGKVLRLVDENTVQEKLEGLFGKLNEPDRRRVQEVLEGLFKAFKDAGVPVVLQLADDPKPKAVLIMQFSDDQTEPTATLLPLGVEDASKPNDAPRANSQEKKSQDEKN